MRNFLLFLVIFFSPLLHADNPPWIGNTIWLELVEGTTVKIPFARFLLDESTPVEAWRTEEVGFVNPGVSFANDAITGKVDIPASAETLPYQYRFFLYAKIGGKEKMVWVFLNIRPAHDRRVRWRGYVSAKTPEAPVWTFITGAVGEKKSVDLRPFVYNPMGSVNFRLIDGPTWLTVSRTGRLESAAPFSADQVGEHKLKIRVSDLMSEDVTRLSIVIH